MKNIIIMQSKKVFDGEAENIPSFNFDLTINQVVESINLNNLKPIEEIIKYKNSISPDDISNDLSLKVTNFDGMKIYHGSKKGLKLFFWTSELTNKILLFSFGEYQPGRFICNFEGHYK
jgi:hypothetical protein